MPDVYIAGSLRHTPKDWWNIYQKLGDLAKSFGLNTHIPHIDTIKDIGATLEGLHDPELNLEIRTKAYMRNYDVIHSSKLIIAEITNPSTGTGIEIGWALKLNKAIICLAHKDADVTSMVLGPVHLGKIDFIRYENEEEALSKLRDLLQSKYGNLAHNECL